MNLLESNRGRKFLFAALYLSEGAPVGYIWWALPTQLRASGVGIGEITSLTSLLILPWILKALWAPFVDTVRTRRWTRREWILSAQVVMGAALLPAIFLDYSSHFSLISGFLLLHAFAASIQDAAIDSLAISTVPAGKRGSLNGWMQTGYLAGRSVFGGFLLILSDLFGPHVLALLLVITIWGIASIVMFTTALPPGQAPPADFRRSLGDFRIHLRRILRQRTVWLALSFALLAGAAFEGVGAVGGPYLIDQGLSRTDVGWFFSIPAVAGMIAGSLLGGFLTDRMGTRRSVGLSLSAVSAVVLCMGGMNMFADPAGHGGTIALFTLLYLFIGMFTSSSYAMFMDRTDPSLGATQFSAYMGATNGCESWAGFATGRMVESGGYGPAFGILGIVSLLTLPLLHRLHRRPVMTGGAESGGPPA